MNDYKKIMTIVIIISILALTACSTQLNLGLDGQINRENGSGSLDLKVGLEESDIQPDSQTSSSSTQQDERITLQSNGLLLIFGLGLLVLIGLIAGLLRLKGHHDNIEI